MQKINYGPNEKSNINKQNASFGCETGMYVNHNNLYTFKTYPLPKTHETDQNIQNLHNRAMFLGSSIET